MSTAKHCEPVSPRSNPEAETAVWFLIVILIGLFGLAMFDLVQKIL